MDALKTSSLDDETQIAETPNIDATQVSSNSTQYCEPTIAQLETEFTQKSITLQKNARKDVSPKKAIIAACLVPPYGLYLGVKLLSQTKKSNQELRDPIATIIFSVIFLVLWPTLVIIALSAVQPRSQCSRLGAGIHKINDTTTFVCQ